MEKVLLIVDGHAYAYRAFYAIRQLTSAATGQPTNAIYGFIRMLAKMRLTINPTHLAVAWDGGLAKERVALLPEYKAQRPAVPDALETQLLEIYRFLKASNITSHLQEGFEADDCIATIARNAVGQGFQVVIASSDKDFFQLVSTKVGILNPNDKEAHVWREAEVRNKTGVAPTQIVDWLALVGDAVDNIPGVPGIGAISAARLLNEFHSVDELFYRLEEVPSARLRTALSTAESDIKRNREIIRLREGLSGFHNCEAYVLQAPDCEALHSLYSEWGFKGLLTELDRQSPAQQSMF